MNCIVMAVSTKTIKSVRARVASSRCAFLPNRSLRRCQPLVTAADRRHRRLGWSKGGRSHCRFQCRMLERLQTATPQASGKAKLAAALFVLSLITFATAALAFVRERLARRHWRRLRSAHLHLAAPPTVSNRDGVAHLRNIDPHENFGIIRHGSSSCDEDRLGQPRATLGRAV